MGPDRLAAGIEALDGGLRVASVGERLAQPANRLGVLIDGQEVRRLSEHGLAGHPAELGERLVGEHDRAGVRAGVDQEDADRCRLDGRPEQVQPTRRGLPRDNLQAARWPAVA
jgi:hypothetical protein